MLFVVNPKAAGGEVSRRWPKVQSRLRPLVEEMEVEYTSGPMTATRLIRSSLEAGEGNIAIVGGDGTVNEAFNGFVEDDRLVDRQARLTIIPVGSGTDYAKTLRLPIGLDQADQILQSEALLDVDVGKATYSNLEGDSETRYFANILGAGVDAAIMDKVNRSRKPFGGRAAFLWAILTTLPSYENEWVEVEVDGKPVARGPMNSVIVANGQYYGSGLRPAPMAEIDDGTFDVVLIGDVSLGEALSNLGKLRKGEHLRLPKVNHLRGRKVVATSEQEVLAEMDGEVVGRLPMDVAILPRLLPVRVLSISRSS